ncbi:hypothetical protein HG531_013111 [Fusarium graminearum]|nr:hypothetical protein HG531_013111 [Fusarium graminearum]
MSDDNTLDVRVVKISLDAMRQSGQDGRVDIAAINIGDLHAPDVGDVAELRDSVDQRLDAQCTSLVTRSLIGRTSRTSDGTTSREDGDVGKTSVEALKVTNSPGDKLRCFWLRDRGCKGS